jgi:phosphoglycolate phosphatase
MRYRLIVWDFDGTLANTLALALPTYNDLAARHGFRRVDDPAAVRGMGTWAFLQQHGISLVRLPLLLKASDIHAVSYRDGSLCPGASSSG